MKQQVLLNNARAKDHFLIYLNQKQNVMNNYLTLKQAVSWFRSILLLLLAIAGMTVFGQERSISGSITDRSTNESLPGASVLVKGTSIGSITDIDGNFSLKIPPGDNTLPCAGVRWRQGHPGGRRSGGPSVCSQKPIAGHLSPSVAWSET